MYGRLKRDRDEDSASLPHESRGRGRLFTRPSWLTEAAFRQVLAERLQAEEKDRSEAEDLELLLADDDSRAAEALPETRQEPLSRVVTLKNVFDPKRVAKNRYLAGDEDAEEDEDENAGDSRQDATAAAGGTGHYHEKGYYGGGGLTRFESGEGDDNGDRKAAEKRQEARNKAQRRREQQRQRRATARRYNLNFSAFKAVENDMIEICCQFGFVRYAELCLSASDDGGPSSSSSSSASAGENDEATPSDISPSMFTVRVGFAEKDAAKQCIDTLHGRPAPWLSERQQQPLEIVADYDVSDAAACGNLRVSRAVWIGNVFDPRSHAHESAARRPAAAVAAAPASGANEAAGVNFFDQLESDFVCECSRFGPLAIGSAGTARRAAPGVPTSKSGDAWRVTAWPLEGAIHVVFESIVSASDCVAAMDGRWFDERQMWAEFDLDFLSDTADFTGPPAPIVTAPPSEGHVSCGPSLPPSIRGEMDNGKDLERRGERVATSSVNQGDSGSFTAKSLFSLGQPARRPGMLKPTRPNGDEDEGAGVFKATAVETEANAATTVSSVVPAPPAGAFPPPLMMGLVDYDSENSGDN